MIDSGGSELLELNDPISSETWASGLLDMFERVRWQAKLDGIEAPPFEEALLERCRERRDKSAAVVAAALSSVVPPPLRGLAMSVASELRESVAVLPSWVGTVGHCTPTRSWIASDVFGDQDSLVIGFRQEGRVGEHALVVLVDHNLSGQAKDAWVGADYDDVLASWRSTTDAHMRMSELPLDHALPRLRDALAISDLWNGDTELRTEDFAQHRAMIWARLGRHGFTDDHPTIIEVTPAERDALVRDFMESPPRRDLLEHLAQGDVELLVHHLVDLRSDYEGRPLRWSPIVVSLLLGDLAPRKLLLDADRAQDLPDVLRAFVRFSADRTGLDEKFVREILAEVDVVEHEYLSQIDDPATAGPAKALLAALQARGVDLTDLDAINEALEGSGPLRLPEVVPKRTRRTTDVPSDVVSSAEGAPALSRFGALTDFYGNGRKLTQTGQPTLADARQLMALLETRDRFDQRIGDRTFKTKSAAELPELAFTLRWAIAAGALRKEHGKLRATTAWEKLDGKLLERWIKSANALPGLGPIAAYQANNRFRHGEEILDELAPEILGLLKRHPMQFETMLDWVCERADAAYEWLTPYMQDPIHRRTSLGWDLDLLTRILGWAGITERIGATMEHDRYDGERLVGGMLRLTPVGTWWLRDE